MRIAFCLERATPDSPGPRISPLTADILRGLTARGAQVSVLVVEDSVWDMAHAEPQHDLYVLKSKSPLTLSLAEVWTRVGAVVVNRVAACQLARDKIVATARLAAAGIPVPPSWATGQPDRLRPLVETGPLWVKPPRGSQGRGVRRVTEPDELDPAPPVDPYGLPLPLLAQREAATDGHDLKVFVVGERMWAIRRPFPARTLQTKQGTPVILPADVHDIALACGRTLGLELYGVDFAVSGGHYCVIDVNAFPGYKGATGAACALADYIFSQARKFC